MLFTPKLKEDGYLQDVAFHLFQVGSRKLNKPESFEQQRWPVLGKQLSVYGFEADPAACAAANAQAQQAGHPWREIHIPRGDRRRGGNRHPLPHPISGLLFVVSTGYDGLRAIRFG
ncbi:MAG: hypothetical protein SNJ60_00495 [Pseudanabaenaceae cyanobacterium]